MQSVKLGLTAHLVTLGLVLPVLSSCGGGGGGGSNSSGYSSGSGGSYGTINNAPRWSADSEAVEVAENSTEITLSATASDADGDTLAYSVGGDDAGNFTITSSGVLSFITAPDFESPQDADSDNIYELLIDASDGSATASLTVSVNVTDVDEGSGSGGPVTGVVVAGSYLSEAVVFQDVNEDGVKNETEAGATTDAQGAFSFVVEDYIAGKILSVGGVAPESGTSYGTNYVLNGGFASEESLIISPLGSLLETARDSSDEAVVEILQALQISEGVAIRDPLEALGATSEGASEIALSHAQLSIITASISAITGLSTSDIEEAIVVRARTTPTLLLFSSVQLLADVVGDLDSDSLNAYATEVTGSLGRFLQQMVATDAIILSEFSDVGLRVVVADLVAISAGDTELAEEYRENVLALIQSSSALTGLASQLPNFNEFSYRIDEGAAGGYQYTIDGADATSNDIVVYARIGDTIRFDNVIALSTHPFRLGRVRESSPLTEAEGVVFESNHHVALVVNENTPSTIYPYCTRHTGMFDRGRIEIVDSFESLDFPRPEQGALQVRGVVVGGKYDGAAGYTYDMYLSQEEAEAASDQNIHQHRMEDMPTVPFFMPDGQGYHGAAEPSSRLDFKPISVQE